MSAVFVLRLLLPSPKALKIEIIKNRIDPNQCMFQKEKEKTSFYDKKEKKNSIKKKKIYILFLREKNIYILKRFSFYLVKFVSHCFIFVSNILYLV